MSIIVEKHFHFDKGRRGRKVMEPGPKPLPVPSTVPWGRTLRVSRMMALALTFEGMLREGDVRNYADMARQARVSSAYVTQIMSLVNLAPDIQEHILFLRKVDAGRDTLTVLMMLKVSSTPLWTEQRLRWAKICQRIDATTSDTLPSMP